MMKYLSTFCLCAETLSEAEFKSDRLINLIEKILRQTSFKATTWEIPKWQLEGGSRKRAS
jgi:hypothetical protein